jgi:hypothetical protein
VARFSPYFERAGENGVVALRAHHSYRAAYPWSEDELLRLAYHFEFEYGDGRPRDLDNRIKAALGAAIARWQDAHAQARLDLHRGPSILVIVDTRHHRPIVFVLRATAAALYEQLDEITSEARLVQAAREATPDLAAFLGAFDEGDVAFLDQAAREVQGLEAEWVEVPPPFGLFPPDEAEAAIAVRAWLGELATIGLVLSEADHHLALAVRRGRTVEQTDSRAEPAAHGPALTGQHTM